MLVLFMQDKWERKWPPNMTNGHVLLRGPESSPKLQSTILTRTEMVGCIRGDGGVTRGGWVGRWGDGGGMVGGGMGVVITTKTVKEIFMSFCRILSTLCRQVVFHIVPHFGKRAGQKVQREIAAAVQNVKPLYFLSRYFEISVTNCHQSFFLF